MKNEDSKSLFFHSLLFYIIYKYDKSTLYKINIHYSLMGIYIKNKAILKE